MADLWDAFLTRVVERGEYSGAWEADHAVRVVLGLLGEHLVGSERARLAARLPEVYTAVLSTVADLAEPWLLQRVLTQLPDGYDLLFGHRSAA